MPVLRSQKGAAMVTALMLTVLALVISMTLLYTVTSGTRMAASQKRYRTALAAAHGGVDLFTLEMIPQLLQAVPKDTLLNDFAGIGLELPQFACLRQKMDNPTDSWNLCSDQQASSDPEVAPDAVFRLGSSDPGRKGFRVSTKIVDTIPGNTDKSGIDYLDLGSSVASRDEIIHPRHVPAMYSLSVQGVREGGEVREKARLSVLYAY